MPAVGNAREIADRFFVRLAAFNPEMQRAITAVGRLALRISRKQITALIYAKPIPLHPKTGKPLWKRTGALRRGERLQVELGELQAVLINEVEYAVFRHEMGKPGRRQTRFPAHWREETIKMLRQEVGKVIHAHYLRALGHGLGATDDEGAAGVAGDGTD